MSARVRSPDVGQAFKKVLGLTSLPIAGIAALPAVVGAVTLPFEEYGFFSATCTGTIDGSVNILTVPKNEDWIIKSMSVAQNAGNGHIDYIYASPTNRKDMFNPAGSTGGTVFLYGAVSTFPAFLSPCDFHLSAETVLNFYEDFNAVNDNYTFMGTVIRRKW